MKFYVRRRAEQLADEFIKLLIDAEEFESYRNIDDPISEETVNGLKEFLEDVKKEGVYIEKEFSMAFFRMVGFYPQFYSDHVYEDGDCLCFRFRLSGLETDALLVKVIYDRELREGETKLLTYEHFVKVGNIE